MARDNTSKKTNGNNARPQGHTGFEATLWATADKLRGNLDVAEYKHVEADLVDCMVAIQFQHEVQTDFGQHLVSN